MQNMVELVRLVRVEAGTAAATEHVDVPNGENVLGRGPFLKVTDKRVSRNHALLMRDAGRLELVPKHKNPCFYRKCGESDFTVLAKGVTQLLHDGDEFSLLPKELIFRVESKSSPTKVTPDMTSPVKKESIYGEKEQSPSLPAANEASGVEDKKTSELEVTDCKPRKLPSLLISTTGEGAASGEGKKKAKVNKRPKPSEAAPVSKEKAVDEEDEIKRPAKKTREDSTEPAVTKVADVDSDDKVADVDSDEVVSAARDKTVASNSATDKRLPLCPYGKKCYRKNPVHFKEYSHDCTDDVISDDIIDDDDDKPACPYGTACYRKNPLHREQYSHNAPPISATTGASPTRASNRPKRKAKVSALAGDSDDDGGPNTYDYSDSFIDDAALLSDESTEYGGESEDSDWAPAADNEDVTELVDEAKGFISNKKMLKP